MPEQEAIGLTGLRPGAEARSKERGSGIAVRRASPEA